MLHFEGRVLHVYVDQAGYETIGEGHKCSKAELSSGFFPGGVQAAFDTKYRWTITAEQSSQIFQADIAPRAAKVDELVTFPLDGGADQGPQRDALILWHFNTGGLEGSRLLVVLNQGNLIEAAGEMLRWNHIRDPKTGEKVVDRGLTLRRQAEANLFLNGYDHRDTQYAMEQAVAHQFALFDLLPEHSPNETEEPA